MMEEIIEKAKILTEALPYIKEFNGITVHLQTTNRYLQQTEAVNIRSNLTTV